MRVQQLAGEPEKNVISNGPLKTCESQATELRTLDLMWLSTHPPTGQSTSHIFLSFHGKSFRSGNVNSIFSVITVFGILQVNVLYFMRS